MVLRAESVMTTDITMLDARMSTSDTHDRKRAKPKGSPPGSSKRRGTG